jgi:hypothetical protein
MSALVILECNACGAITPPWPTADRAREEAGPDGWAVDVDGSNVDYCQQCTGPARLRPVGAHQQSADFPAPPVSRLDVARAGVLQLRDALAAMCVAYDATPSVFVSVANLARVRADQLLAELAA